MPKALGPGSTQYLHKEIAMYSESADIAVQTESLAKRFGRQWALAHCDLQVPQGEVLLLAGSNGSGKTTLLRLIAGLYKPTQGDLRLFGLDPGEERLACRRALTLVGHDNYLYSQLTALEMLQVWARLVGTRTRDQDLIALLAEVDLADRRDYPVGGFSAGMRKRLTLLRTKLESSRLVLLDEPFAALDADGQQLIENWVQAFRSQGKTVILASHNLPRASRLCDRAVLLREGQLVWTGSGSGLLDQVGTAL
jgi:heme ABC exporter ATP-binding subunit CcmA